MGRWLAFRHGLYGFCGRCGGAFPWRLGRSVRRADSRSPYRKIWKGRQGKGHSRTQHVPRCDRPVRSVARLVRLQSRLHHELSESGRCGFHSDDHEYCCHRCGSDIHHYFLDLSGQTGSGHDHQRLSGRPGGNHRKLCLCKRVKLPDHRRNRRCAGGFPGGIF